MKKIVILGAGYGGVGVARGLSKVFGKKEAAIILIDKHNYHQFNPNLYEIATAEEEMVSQSQLKKSITIPLKEIFDGTNVELLQSEVLSIDPQQQLVQVSGKKISYDYLIVAAGSVTDYFGVEGAEKFSLTLKSLPDAFRIKNQIEFAFQSRRMDMSKKNIRIVVAGGGYTGVEFAAELSHEVEILAWKNQYPREKIEISIIEASPQLISGFSNRLSQDALWELKNRGVRVQLSSPIFKVDQHFVELVTQEKIEYDVLVWTTGVKARTLPFLEPLKTDKKARIIVNEFLQVSDKHNIFALGDCACIINLDGRPAPPTAQDAIEHASYLSYAMPIIMQNKRPAPYKGNKHGFVVTLGGKQAILDYGIFYTKGFIAYVIRQLVNLHYYAGMVGWWKAIKYIILQVELYSRND